MVLAAVIGLVITSIWAGVVCWALVLIRRGLVGRQVDQEARCRRCRYILTCLSPRPAVCPECGGKLASPNDVRIGLRQRRPWQTTAGVSLLLLGLGAVGLLFLPVFGTPTTAPAAGPAWIAVRAPGPPNRGGGGSSSSAWSAGASAIGVPGAKARTPRSTVQSRPGGSTQNGFEDLLSPSVPLGIAGHDPAWMTLGRVALPAPVGAAPAQAVPVSAEISSELTSGASIRSVDSPVTDPVRLGGTVLDDLMPRSESGLAKWASGASLALQWAPGEGSGEPRVFTRASGKPQGAAYLPGYAGGYAGYGFGRSPGASSGPASMLFGGCRWQTGQVVAPARSTGTGRSVGAGRIRPVSFK